MHFEEIYRTYSKRIYNLTLQYIQNIEDAEEITQDVFVAVHQSIHTFKEQSKLSTWIYRIAINKSLDFIRSKKRKKSVAFFTSLFNADGNEVKHDFNNFNHPGVELEQKETMAFIFSHINNLPKNQKTAFILSKLEQKSQKEISDIMNISAKAVESLVQRAKASLSKKINVDEGNKK